jgi:hypothetical protein
MSCVEGGGGRERKRTHETGYNDPKMKRHRTRRRSRSLAYAQGGGTEATSKAKKQDYFFVCVCRPAHDGAGPLAHPLSCRGLVTSFEEETNRGGADAAPVESSAVSKNVCGKSACTSERGEEREGVR